MIRVSVDGRPELFPFELDPPLPAKVVIDLVASQLDLESRYFEGWTAALLWKDCCPGW